MDALDDPLNTGSLIPLLDPLLTPRVFIIIMKKVINCTLFIILIHLHLCQVSRFCKTPCGPASECVNGLCVPTDMPFLVQAPNPPPPVYPSLARQSPCPAQTICLGGYCLPNYCAPCVRGSLCPRSYTCPDGFMCSGNQCVRDCVHECPPGVNCLVNEGCRSISPEVRSCRG